MKDNAIVPAVGLLGAVCEEKAKLKKLKLQAENLLNMLGIANMFLTGEKSFVAVLSTNQIDTVRQGTSGRFLVGAVLDPCEGVPENGHFLYLDAEIDKKFFFRTDPVGLVNLYRCRGLGITLFGTSSLQLAVLVPHLSCDETGMYEFLMAGYPISDRTFYAGVSVVPGGVDWLMEHGDEQKYVEKQWYSRPVNADLSAHDAILQLTAIARESAMGVGRSGYPCCDLTGGFDSRGITAMFLAADVPFSTVVNGPKGLQDVRVAAEIAALFDIDHHCNDTDTLPCPDAYSDIRDIILLTDGEIDVPEYYHTASIQRKTASLGWVTVNGSGGELFRGYWWEGEWPSEGTRGSVDVGYLVKRVLLPWQDFSVYKEKEGTLIDHFHSEVKRVTDSVGEGLGMVSGQRIDQLYYKVRLGRWLARYYSSTQKILPCYSPFILKPALEVAFRIDPTAKKRVRFYRQWLAEVNKPLADIKLESGMPATPLSLMNFWKYGGYSLSLARKVYGKVYRTFASGRTVVQEAPPFQRAYFRLMSEEVSKNGLEPQAEKLLRGEMIQKFTGGKNILSQPGMLSAGQVSRILTVNMTFREVSELRAALQRNDLRQAGPSNAG